MVYIFLMENTNSHVYIFKGFIPTSLYVGVGNEINISIHAVSRKQAYLKLSWYLEDKLNIHSKDLYHQLLKLKSVHCAIKE